MNLQRSLDAKQICYSNMKLYDVRKRKVYELMLPCSIQTIVLYLQCST